MAINVKYQTYEPTGREFRESLRPFLDNESGIKALQAFIDPEGNVSREGMYILNIINNLIQSNNGTENLYQRIPPEIFGGLPEGGRRNVQASLVARAVLPAGQKEPERVPVTDLTRVQQVVQSYANFDGCWHDTPDRDLLEAGLQHDPDIDGSEAHVFDRSGDPRLYKTIDIGHYSDLESMLDRVAIHNATFPEMAMRVEGYGLRDDALTNKDFVLVVSQPKAVGRRPTKDEMEQGMAARGYVRCDNGFESFYVSQLDNTVICDIHEENCVMTDGGHLLVFDCEAFLKRFPMEPVHPKVMPFDKVKPDQKTLRVDEEAWKEILGDEYYTTGKDERSRIVRELSFTRRCGRLVNGQVLMLDDDKGQKVMIDGEEKTVYGGNLLYGPPKAFRQEHVFKIPDIQYDEQSVKDIRDTAKWLMPASIDLEEFLYNPKLAGNATAQYHGGGDLRKWFRDELKRTGRIGEPVNGRYIVQTDPDNPGKVLVSDMARVSFMLNTDRAPVENGTPLTEKEKAGLVKGETIIHDGRRTYFDIDKGRVNQEGGLQQRLRQAISQPVRMPEEQTQKKPAKLKL